MRLIISICAPDQITSAAEPSPGPEQNPQNPALKGRTGPSNQNFSLFIYLFVCFDFKWQKAGRPKPGLRGSTCSQTWTRSLIQTWSAEPAESTSCTRRSSASALGHQAPPRWSSTPPRPNLRILKIKCQKLIQNSWTQIKISASLLDKHQSLNG